MKIKTLIIAALLVGASVASTMAQVYSANAVGYVNVTIVSGKTILANPLNNGDNHADAVLPLPAEAVGMLIFRFDAGTQNYGTGITYLGPDGGGWVNVDTFMKEPPELFTLAPGEAFFVQNVGGAVDATFVGDVPQGDLSNPLVGENNKNLVSSQVPQEAPLGDPTQADTLGFPAATGDLVFLWDDVTQNFAAGVTYVEGLGWVDVNTFEPINGGGGPILPVARGFFVQKIGPISQSWDRSFSVN
jgi:hypothetical protein